MAENENKNNGLNVSRRDFLKLVTTGAVATAATAALPTGVVAAEKSAANSRPRNALYYSLLEIFNFLQ